MDTHKHFLENDALLHSSESNEKHVLPTEGEKGEIILYQPDDKICLEVRLEEETVWLTQAQIADLFGVKQPAISKHLSNIFKSGELDEKRVYSILEYTATDGKIYKTKFYNLDAIVSVGYRVNSINATRFRQWATSVLKQYIPISRVQLPQSVHDRYLIIDNEVWLLGASVKDMGRGLTTVIKLSFIPEDILSRV